MFFFFFKQKTAYEMRISDWSSDVCSSDLVTSAGHLLAFPVSELPELDKGKGNKIIEIPKAKRGTEHVVAIAAVSPGGTLSVKSGARTMSLSFKDLDQYIGARASRGGLLPRGWQKVEGLHVDP